MNRTDQGQRLICAEDQNTGSLSFPMGESERSRELDAFVVMRISLDFPDEIESILLCGGIVGNVLRALTVGDARAAEIERAVSAAAADVIGHAADPGSGYRVAADFFLDRVRVRIMEPDGASLREAEYSFPRPIAAQPDPAPRTIPDNPTGEACLPEPPRRPAIGARSL